MVAAVVDEIDILFLQTRYQGREVFLTGGDTVKEHHVSAALLQVILYRAGQALAILLFVVDNRDALRLHFFQDIFCSGWPLIGVQTGGAQNQMIAASRQLRRGGGRGNHQHAFIFIDIRGRLGGRRAQVTDDVLDTVVNHFVSDGNRLFRVTGVVVFYHLQLIAFDAAFSVDIGNGLLSASKLLVAVLRYRTGHRANDGDFDIFSHCRTAHD